MIEPYEYLHLIRHHDGTITRKPSPFPTTAATPDSSTTTPVLSKDIPINPTNNTWARIFLPRQSLRNPSPPPTKLPLIIYFHGGGFVIFSAATEICHNFCLNIAAELPAVVVSVEYRLAPEHRLPAAYDDAIEALHWIKTCREEWIEKYADFSTCFFMGTSAGGNIAYNVGHRAADIIDELAPLRIRGLVLNQPFFGGVHRSGSELRLVEGLLLPPHVCDVMWDLSLPAGANRDHVYCNPTVESGSNVFEKIRWLGWTVLVNGCEGDPLVDRQMEAAELMEKNGVIVARNFVDGGYHGAEYFNISWTKALCSVLKGFVSSTKSMGGIIHTA